MINISKTVVYSCLFIWLSTLYMLIIVLKLINPYFLLFLEKIVVTLCKYLKCLYVSACTLYLDWCFVSFILIFLCPPWKRGYILFCNCWSVGRSVRQLVGRSVCKPSVVRSISFDPFTWSIPNLVQGLSSVSRWSLLIFRSHVRRSRSNHSSLPTVLFAQYLLTPSLDQYITWCRGPLWVDDPFWFSGHMLEGQGQTTLLSPLCCSLNILTPSLDQYQTWCRGCTQWVADPYWFSGHMFKG